MTSSQSRSLRGAIQSEARRLGFQLVGVTSPDPPPHIQVYESWLNAGLHGEMQYLSTQRARLRRADPHRILPTCRSILVLGIPYPSPPPTGQASQPASPAEQSPIYTISSSLSPNLSPVPSLTQASILPLSTAASEIPPLYGRVASYAWGNDYHDVLAQRLRLLVAFIEHQVGAPVPNRWYTDTGPLLERQLAQRAGLGWIGKNTCLIHPRQGSYFLLAEILLGLDLEPDSPFAPDYCGDCRRCLEVCPTACILPNRTLDSRRCISYLTIELKGPIPLELRAQIGNWVFGCDLCQQVCPWNQRFSSQEGDPAFAPRPGVPSPHLISELSLTPQAFNLKFKGSPIKRARLRGYLRNVAVALGNRGDPAAVPALAEAVLHHPEPLVRGHASWALGRIGGKPARQTLSAAAHSESDPYVQTEIRSSLESS